MGASCTVCRLPSAGSIDALLASGRSVRSLAVELGLSRDALGRHARGHRGRRTASPSSSSPATSDAPPDPLHELVVALRGRALAGDPGLAREYRLALAAQADERHAAPPRTDLASEPEWIALRTLMLQALEPYPKARLAVAEALAKAGMDR